MSSFEDDFDGWIKSRPMTVKEHEQKVKEECAQRELLIAHHLNMLERDARVRN